jgi:hypothetical protein
MCDKHTHSFLLNTKTEETEKEVSEVYDSSAEEVQEIRQW